MKSPLVEFRDGVFYVVLDAATPHGRGVQHGLALRLPIRRTLAQFKRWIPNEVGVDDPNEAIAEFAASSTQ
jgi:isopenicillin-N N-acyltransferase-like protein